MFYNLDIPLQIHRLLPTFLRKVKMKSLLESYLQPLNEVHGDFIQYRTQNLKELSITNQTIMFEWGINNVFDNTNRGIFIENQQLSIIPAFIYHDDENEPETYVFHDSEGEQHFHLYHDSEIESQVNFILNVPNALNGLNDAIIKFIEQYNHTGMNYIIIYY